MLKVEKFVFESFTELNENQSQIPSPAESIPALVEEIKTPVVEQVTNVVKDVFSQFDLDQVKKQAFDEGYNKAQLELDKSILVTNQSLTLVLERIKSTLDEIANSSSNNENLINDCNNLALKVAKKIAGDALKEDPIAKICEIVSKCLNLLKGKMTINLVINPAIESELKLKLDDLIKITSFAGEIVIRTDQTLAQTDCHIEWQNGYIESNKEQIWQQIEQQINNS